MVRSLFTLTAFLSGCESFLPRQAASLGLSARVGWGSASSLQSIQSGASFSTEHAPEEPDYDGVNHVGVLISSVPTSVKWYTTVLGFKDESHLRPNLPFPGAFLRVGAHQVQ